MLGLAPWRRGWRLLWRFPAVWWAFAATGVVLVLASTITPLYVSAAASASVAAQQAGRCPWAAGMQAHGRGPVELADSVEAQRARSAEHIAGQVLGRSAAVTFALDGERAHLGPALVSLQGGPLGLLPGPHHQFDQTVRLLFRQQAEQHIQVLERVPGQGFLLTKEAAANVEVKPGGSLTIRAVDGHLVRAPVVGIYTDMAKQPMTEFWCSLDHFIHQRDPLGNNVPPPLLLATDSATTIDLLRQLHPRAPVDVEAYVQRPLRPGLRMDQAEQALAAVNEGRSSVPADDQFRPAAPFVLTELPFIVRRAHALRHALLPPVAALSVGAALAALGLVAVAGSFWAERRRTELDVLSSRGVGPGAQALKAAIECAPPLLLGLLAGSALSVAVVRWLGPDGEPAPVAMNQAAGLAIGGWLLALLVLAGCVAARRRAPRPRRVGGRTGFLLLAVELVGLVVSLVALGRVSSTEVESDLSALPTFGLSRLLLPLGVLVFGSLALVRMLTMTLPSLRNRGQRWPTTVLLAVQRLAAVPRVPAALALGVAISAGTGVFAGGVAGSLQRTVDAKAQVFVGSDTAFELLGPQPIPAVGTTVFRPPDTRAEDRAVRVLAIDPTTFTSHAFWDPDFSSTSIEELVGRLGPASDGQLPAILVGGRLGDDPVVEVPMNAQTLRVPMTVVGRARGFPGMTTDPLLVVSEPALRQGQRRCAALCDAVDLAPGCAAARAHAAARGRCQDPLHDNGADRQRRSDAGRGGADPRHPARLRCRGCRAAADGDRDLRRRAQPATAAGRGADPADGTAGQDRLAVQLAGAGYGGRRRLGDGGGCRGGAGCLRHVAARPGAGRTARAVGRAPLVAGRWHGHRTGDGDRADRRARAPSRLDGGCGGAPCRVTVAAAAATSARPTSPPPVRCRHWSRSRWRCPLVR